MKSKVYSLDNEEFIILIKKSKSFSEVLRVLGYTSTNGGGYKTLKKRISELSIDTSHMTHTPEFPHGFKKLYLDEEVFCENSKYRKSPRKRIIKDKLIPYKCAVCGNTGVWMNKPLTLTLDHINGNHKDNRLDNLRFICPNCDSQQSTYAGKNKNRY